MATFDHCSHVLSEFLTPNFWVNLEEVCNIIKFVVNTNEFQNVEYITSLWLTRKIILHVMFQFNRFHVLCSISRSAVDIIHCR